MTEHKDVPEDQLSDPDWFALHGTDYRGPDRRIHPEAVRVIVDSVQNGAAQKLDKMARDVKLAVRSVWALGFVFLAGTFGAGAWFSHVNDAEIAMQKEIARANAQMVQHETIDDSRTFALMKAVSEVSETTAAIVAEQQSLRRDVEALKRSTQ